MATMTITIPDAIDQDVREALATYGNWQGLPEPRPAKGAFARQVVIDFMKAVYRQHKGEAAAKAAGDTARTQADADAQIT